MAINKKTIKPIKRQFKKQDGGLVEYTTGGTIGSIGGVLGAIPTPFTQIAGAALGVVGGLIGSAEERKAAEIERQKQAVGMADASQSSIMNPYTATFAMGGEIEDPKKASQLYNPLLNKVNETYMNVDIGGTTTEQQKNMTNNMARIARLSSNNVDSVFNYNTGQKMPRNLPPMDSTLQEMQGKISNMPIEDAKNLLTVDWRKKGFGIKDIPTVYRAAKNSGVSLGDMYGYYKHIKGLKDQGYTYAQGGITNGMPNVEVEGDEVMQGPDGSMALMQGPSHAQGGMDISAEPGTRVFSDKLKSNTGKTFAEEADDIRKRMAKYEKMLS